MNSFFLVLSLLLITLSLLPFIKNQHWVFRVPEFFKIQLFILQITATTGLFIFAEKSILFWLIVLCQVLLIFYHAYLLGRFIKLKPKQYKQTKNLKEIKVISANIYQFNKEFNRFKDLIRKEKPAIFVTIESNKDWELALRDLENDYPYTEKVTLENTYGMHLYAKMPLYKVTTHYFVADDLPSIEAHFKTEDGEEFVVFCAHPPPPSPTEERTSKERDGDLMCIAKRAKEINKPTLVIGDFNTVAWSKISKLFQKNSEFIDGRIGRGILATYHAKYWLFRAPLDLVFHSTTIFIKELKVLEYICSDHLPICCVFNINQSNVTQEKEVETINKEEQKETAAFIEKGKKENSNNRSDL